MFVVIAVLIFVAEITKMMERHIIFLFRFSRCHASNSSSSGRWSFVETTAPVVVFGNAISLMTVFDILPVTATIADRGERDVLNDFFSNRVQM